MHRCTLPFVVGLAACAPRSRPAVAPDPRALRDSLVAQFARSADAWNRGDLDGFVSDYAPDSLTSFVSRGHVHHGFAWIRQNYAPRFAPGAARDSLRFEEFEVRPLAPALLLVTARFVLFRDGQTTASGPFTLIMERRTDGWKILHDHSSSD
ncbi:MAG TPA: nuclear transport factor 2 family protein [Gemmatimonadales bacterium]|nr:nuclear transport factor 2 family protein [Gemmatimonadales bacterium]